MTASTTTPESTQVLVDYLHHALAAEHAVADLLAAEPVRHAHGHYPRMVAGKAKRARQRIHELDSRLATLSGPTGTWSATAGTVRRLAADAWEVSATTVTAGIDAVRRPPVEPALVEHVHQLAAAIAVAHTAHRALTEIAQADGDTATAELATACRREHADLRTSIDEAVPEVVATMLESATRPTYRDATAEGATRVREAATHLGDDARTAQHELRDAVTALWRREPKPTAQRSGGRHTIKTGSAVPKPADLPIDDYPQHSAAEIVDRLPQLTPEQLDDVERYERTHAARVTVLNKIQQLRQTPAD